MIILYNFLAVGACVFLCICGQWLATEYDAKRYPATGKFVEIDGRKHHYLSGGVEKGPVVVFDHGCGQVRGATLGNVPLVVIKGGIVENLNGFSEEEAAEVKTALHDVAVEMSHLSKNGELRVVESSGYHVHVDDPELVVKAIRKICYPNPNNKRVESL